jgi:hypothetical protein
VSRRHRLRHLFVRLKRETPKIRNDVLLGRLLSWLLEFLLGRATEHARNVASPGVDRPLVHLTGWPHRNSGLPAGVG